MGTLRVPVCLDWNALLPCIVLDLTWLPTLLYLVTVGIIYKSASSNCKIPKFCFAFHKQFIIYTCYNTTYIICSFCVTFGELVWIVLKMLIRTRKTVIRSVIRPGITWSGSGCYSEHFCANYTLHFDISSGEIKFWWNILSF